MMFDNLIKSSTSIVSEKAVIRVDEGGRLELGEGVKIDDDVRIVVSGTGNMTIAKNSKIGKGTIVNCGGSISIGENTAIYGYCMLQTSLWKQTDEGRAYVHGHIRIGHNVTISPYSLLGMDSVIDDNTLLPPRSDVGKWLQDV